MARKLLRKPHPGTDFEDRKWLQWVADLLRAMCDDCSPSSDKRFFIFRDNETDKAKRLADKLSSVREDHNGYYFTSPVVKAALGTIHEITHKSLMSIILLLKDSLENRTQVAEVYLLASVVRQARRTIQILERHAELTLRERVSGHPWGTINTLEDADNQNNKHHKREDSRWPTVTESSYVTGVNPGVISRAADSGNLKSNGKKGRARRIDSQGLIEWCRDRKAKGEPTESLQHIEALVHKCVKD